MRDPKKRQKKIDDSDTVTRFENLKEYKVFTKEWLKPCIENGLKKDAGTVDDFICSAVLVYLFKCKYRYMYKLLRPIIIQL